jgi:hypothetical protein
MARLIAAYSIASPSDLLINHAVLLGHFSPPDSIPGHILKHVNAHYFATCNGQPYGSAAKIQLFRSSISGCGLFTTALLIWDAAHPTVALQTWDSLAHAITHAAASLTAASSASQGFALAAPPAAAAPPMSVSVHLSMEELTADNRSLRLALAALSGGRSGRGAAATASGTGSVRPAAASRFKSASERGPPTPHPDPNGPGFFCWSHPIQNHPGKECRKPLPGHQPSATWLNKMQSPCH